MANSLDDMRDAVEASGKFPFVTGVVHLEDFACGHEGWFQARAEDGTMYQAIIYKQAGL